MAFHCLFGILNVNHKKGDHFIQVPVVFKAGLTVFIGKDRSRTAEL